MANALLRRRVWFLPLSRMPREQGLKCSSVVETQWMRPVLPRLLWVSANRRPAAWAGNPWRSSIYRAKPLRWMDPAGFHLLPIWIVSTKKRSGSRVIKPPPFPALLPFWVICIFITANWIGLRSLNRLSILPAKVMPSPSCNMICKKEKQKVFLKWILYPELNIF